MQIYFRVGLVTDASPEQTKSLQIQESVYSTGSYRTIQEEPFLAQFLEDLLETFKNLPTSPDGYRYFEGRTRRRFSKRYQHLLYEKSVLDEDTLQNELDKDLQKALIEKLKTKQDSISPASQDAV